MLPVTISLMNKAIAETTKRAPTRPSSTLSLIDGPARPSTKASKMTGADRTIQLKKVINIAALDAKTVPKSGCSGFLVGQQNEAVFMKLHGNMRRGE